MDACDDYLMKESDKDGFPVRLLIGAVHHRGCRILDLIALLRHSGFIKELLDEDTMRTKLLRKVLMYYRNLSPMQRDSLLTNLPSLRSLIPDEYLASASTSTPHVSQSHPDLEQRNWVRSGHFPAKDCFPLSKSSIWKSQNEYYSDKAIAAWNTVPCEISSNAFVAKKYADWIIDNAARESFCKICVLEVGSGHGILSLLLARELQRRLKSDDFLVVCTDFHLGVFHGLVSLPWFRALYDVGVLDFASIIATTCETKAKDSVSSAIEFLNDSSFGCSRFRETRWDQVVVIGNYAFDSFPVDIVGKSRNGTIFEVMWHPREHTDIRNKEERKSQKYKRSKCETSEPQTSQPPNFPDSRKSRNNFNRDSHFLAPREVPVITKTCPYEEMNDAKSDFKSIALEKLRSSEYRPGVYVIPVAAFELFKAIKLKFDYRALETTQSPSYALISGDFFVTPDDLAWKIDTFEAVEKFFTGNDLTIGARSGLSEKQSGFTMSCDGHWFDPPLISPQPTICAFPVSLDGLRLAFVAAFDDEKITLGRPGTQRHLKFPSSFSACVFSSGENLLSDPVEIGGIDEFGHVRQLIKDEARLLENVTLQEWKEWILSSNADMNTFLDAMWHVRTALQTANSATDICDWLQLANRCVSNHYCTNIAEYCLLRERISQWMLSLHREESTLAAVVFLLQNECLRIGSDVSVVNFMGTPFLSIVEVSIYVRAVNFLRKNEVSVAGIHRVVLDESLKSLKPILSSLMERKNRDMMRELWEKDILWESKLWHPMCTLSRRRKIIIRAVSCISKYF